MATQFETVARWMDTQMVDPLRQMLVGRQLFAKVVNLPVGKYNVDYLSMSEMGAAMITMAKPDPAIARDAINSTLTNVPLCWIAKGYKIERATFDAFSSEGIALDTASMLSAAQVCSQKEDDLLIQGWAPDGSTYEIKGLYQSAGNDFSTTKDFGTYGNATDAVAGAKALIRADSVHGVNFNLVLNPVQYGELEASEYNGIQEWPNIMRIINSVANAPKGQIIESVDLTAGNGMLSPVDTTGRLMDLIVGQDYENDLGVDSRSPKNSPIYGALSACLRPRIKQANAIGKLSDI